MTDIFLTVLNMSLTAGYVILFIILVRLPLKKAPKAISYVLWSVAAFRLLCPFSFKSVLSLLPINASPIPKDIAYRQTPQINSGITAIDTYVNNSLPAATPQASANPLQIYTLIGTYIWILGIFVMLIYSIVSVLILKNRLKNAQNIEQNIYEAGCLKTPFVLGLFAPRIFIPAGLTAEEKSYVIRHEKTHIRRFDHIIKPFAFMVLSIHWFNPLVWAAFILMGTDMELSCDERVVRELGFDIKKSYSMSLLSLASGRRILNGSPLAFGEGNVKSRIKNVLNYKKPAFWVVTIAVIAVVIAGIGLLFNPRGNRSNTSSLNWAKSLKADDIQSIELIVQPSKEQERYKKYEPGEFAEIVKLVHQSRGRFIKNPKEMNGSTQTFYITTKDGIIHRFLNEGNEYLIIDSDTFDAGYEWLSKWNYHGESTIPDKFPERVSLTIPVSGGSVQDVAPDTAKTTPLKPAAAEWSRDDVNKNISYTEEEIEAAMECVRKYFTGEAASRVLNDLWFDEEECAKTRVSYMEYGKGNTNGVSAENIIVLLCNFTVENDKTFQGYYPNWHFILIRDNVDAAWRIDGQGV